jgi:hypothetical protein
MLAHFLKNCRQNPCRCFPESTRSQALNQADAVEKLRQAIFQALQPESTRTETEEVGVGAGPNVIVLPILFRKKFWLFCKPNIVS